MGDRVHYQGKGLALVDPGKGRVAIPNSLRAALAANAPREDGKDGGTVVVAVHPKYECLIAYDPAFVPVLKTRLDGMNEQQIERGGVYDYNFLDRAGAAEPLPFDGSGRFILPPWEFEEFGIKASGSAAFVGSFDWITIWDPKTLIAQAEVDSVLKRWVAYECKSKGIAL